MNDQIATLKDDLSFLRAVAEEGRRGPLGGGAFLAASGAIYAGASLIQWGGIERIAGLDLANTGGVWWAASGLWGVVFCLLVALRGKAPSRGGGANRAFAVGWTVAGAAIMVCVGAAAIASAKLHDAAVYQLLPSVVLAFYGAAWAIAAVAARRRWMGAVALLAFALSWLLAALIGEPAVLLGFALALVLLLVAPGLLMMRGQPRPAH